MDILENFPDEKTALISHKLFVMILNNGVLRFFLRLALWILLVGVTFKLLILDLVKKMSGLQAFEFGPTITTHYIFESVEKIPTFYLILGLYPLFEILSGLTRKYQIKNKDKKVKLVLWKISGRVVAYLVACLVSGWSGFLYATIVVFFYQVAWIFVEALQTAFNKKTIEDAIVGLSLSTVFIIIVGVGFYAIGKEDVVLRRGLTREFCENLKMVSIESTQGSFHPGWLFGRSDEQTFLKEKANEGVYENVVFQNESIALVMDMSTHSFEPEKQEAFPKCTKDF